MEKISTKNKMRIQWKWKPKRWWISLMGFCFVCIIGGELLAITKSHHGVNERGLVLSIVILYAICSVSNKRIKSSIVWGIVWIFGVWVGHSFLAVFTALKIMFMPSLSNHLSDYEVNIIAYTLAGIPFVIWSMRRWSYFVEPVSSTSVKEQSKETAEEKTVEQPTMKKCPFCAEEIKAEAIKCRYCGSLLNKLIIKGVERSYSR